jgi:hypothetical protein
MLPKQDMYQGHRFNYKFVYDVRFGGTVTDTSQPANQWNPTEDPGVGFLVSSKFLKPGGILCKDTKCNGLVVYAVANPLWDGTGTDPGVSGAAVPTTHDYIVPGLVKQGPITSGDAVINPGDTSISGQVSYAAGSLFASITTGSGPAKASAILFKIRPHMYNPQVRMLIGATITDESVLDYGANSTFLATTQPDEAGNTLTVFNISGPDYYPSTAIIKRSATQAPGTFQNSGVIVRQGKSPYGNRWAWGDYTAVAPEPMDVRPPRRAKMWFSGEYTQGPNYGQFTSDWHTVIGSDDSYDAATQ